MSDFFNKINYSAANEDGRSEREALSPRLAGGSALCITGSGSRPLELAIANPERIVSLDFNPTQNFLLELKLAAIENLEYEDFLAFLGLTEAKNRLAVYNKLKQNLSSGAKAFWEKNSNWIEIGVIYSGSWEAYLKGMADAAKLFRGPLADELFKTDNLNQQIQFWENKWDTWAWHSFIRLVGVRALWKYVIREPGIDLVPKDLNIGQVIKARFDSAAHHHHLRKCAYAWLLFKGRYNVNEALPCHLEKENYKSIQAAAKNIEIRTESLIGYLESTSDRFSAYSLSDFGSYAPPAMYQEVWRLLMERSVSGARVCEREFLVPHAPEKLAGSRLVRESDLEAKLFIRDRSFIYKFVVGTLDVGQ